MLGSRTNMSRDEFEQMPPTSLGNTMEAFTRRSIRRIGTLKNRLFRLPATPRLSRSRKVLVGRGEESTGWNFITNNLETSVGAALSSSTLDNTVSPPSTPRPARRYRHATNAEYLRIATVNGESCMASHSPVEEQLGGSCRLGGGGFHQSKRKLRLPIPSFHPPPPSSSANGAASSIHDQLRSLMPSPPPFSDRVERTRNRKTYHFLPDTSYGPKGEIASAYWRMGQQLIRDEEPKSSTQSSISLLNTHQTGRIAMRSEAAATSSAKARRASVSYRCSRISQPLNGLFHQPGANTSASSPRELASTPRLNGDGSSDCLHGEMKLPPILFPLDDDGHIPNNADGEFLCGIVRPFLGREWLFKELHKLVLLECSPLTVILGESGTGKSAVVNQLVLHSAFRTSQQHYNFIYQESNANTVDSGIAIEENGSGISPYNSPAFTSINYEWLKMLASRVVAFHFSLIHSAPTCSIPEFVRSIASLLCRSPLVREFYTSLIDSDEYLRSLIYDQGGNALDIGPVELFRRLILEPIALYENKIALRSRVAEEAGGADNENGGKHDSLSLGCQMEDRMDASTLIILVDGLDQAGFHRSDSGESIGWLLSKTIEEFPHCLRFIVTATHTGWATENATSRATYRTIRLDDADVDERVVRDCCLYLHYALNINPPMEAKVCRANFNVENPLTEFMDEVVLHSRGNFQFVSLLLRMIDKGRANQCHNLASISLMPTTLQQLYLLYFNTEFGLHQQFSSVSPVLAVIMASLRPLTFEELLVALNSPSSNNEDTRPLVTRAKLEHSLCLLSPLVKSLRSGHYVPYHQSFREWLVRESNDTEYSIDIRHGHILLALALVRQGNLGAEELFELGHHLLKANPHKYMDPSLAIDMPIHKNAQLEWVRLGAGSRIYEALLLKRNIFYPNLKVSRLLLSAGADVNAIWQDSGESLLSSFARTGNCEMVSLLVQHGAAVDYASTKDGTTPLMVAVERKHAKVAKFLLSYGADQWVGDSTGRNAVVYAASGDALELLRFMLDSSDGINGNGAMEGVEIPFEYSQLTASTVNAAFEEAIRVGSTAICSYLLDHDRMRHLLDTAAAMRKACLNGQTEMVQFLLSRGVTLFERDGEPRAEEHPLLCAVQSGSWDLVVTMLKNPNAAATDGPKLDVNVPSGAEGQTALMGAAAKGHVGLVDLLLSNGAEINIRDTRSRSALMYALQEGQFPAASLLLEKGCELRVKDAVGNTPLHYLARRPEKQLIGHFISAGLSLEEKNNDDLRPLEVAIQWQSYAAVEIFLRHGARLRSITWHSARQSDPQLLCVLVKKLLDDATILFRRGNHLEALHRLNYSLQKCNDLLAQCRSEREDDHKQNNEQRLLKSSPTLRSIEEPLRHYKLHTLLSIAYAKRRTHEFDEALALTEEALLLVRPDDDVSAFELHLFRAKCFFDNQDAVRAREEAERAYSISPASLDVQNLLVALDTSCRLEEQ